VTFTSFIIMNQGWINEWNQKWGQETQGRNSRDMEEKKSNMIRMHFNWCPYWDILSETVMDEVDEEISGANDRPSETHGEGGIEVRELAVAVIPHTKDLLQEQTHHHENNDCHEDSDGLSDWFWYLDRRRSCGAVGCCVQPLHIRHDFSSRFLA
jgi:hypothetical protein